MLRNGLERLFIGRIRHKSSPLPGQAVFLQTAPWFGGDGHFNQAFGQRRPQIPFAKRFAILEPQGGLQGFAAHLRTKRRKKLADLGG